MVNFFDVALSPTAVFKFLHTVSQAYIIGSLFVVSVSAWFILKNRHLIFAKKSIVIASVFGLISSVFVGITGDSSAYDVAHKQPMKLAAMEGLYDGEKNADLYAFGFLNNRTDNQNFNGIRLPSMLSIMAFRDANAFVPGINDLVNGKNEEGILSAETRMEKGRLAIQALSGYKEAKKNGNTPLASEMLNLFETNYPHFGYGYFDDKNDIVPNVPLTFYSFHLMVALGLFFVLFFAWLLFAVIKDKLTNNKLLLRISLWSVLLGYIASELGWIVAEVGRQPWTIQDLLPVGVATSHLSVGSVQTTFFMFLTIFTVLLIAEIKILTTQIKKGPEEGGSHV
jgi:cytochrome d ubiquinol oxidase subunit I